MKTQLKEVVGRSVNAYNQKVKPKIDDIKFKEQYQGRIIDCMVGEIDDDYIETPETDSPIVKLEYSKEGVVKIPSIKGKTILVDADGNETDTPGEGCKLVSVGDDGKLVVTTRNKNLFDGYGNFIDISGVTNLKISSANTSGCERILFALYDCDGVLINDSGIQTSSNFYHRSSDGLWMLSANAQTLNHTITLNGDFKYIRFTNMNGNHSYSLYNDIQLEVGVVISPYVPHQSHTVEILLDEPLRSLPNGVCDERINNKLIKKTYKLILDGREEEKWGVASCINGENYFVWNIRNTKIPLVEGGTTLKNNQISTTYKIDNPYMGYNENSCWIYSASDTLTVMRIRNINIEPTVSAIREELRKNPITMIYQVLEPITEELSNAIALQGFDDTTVYVETNLNPTAKYGYNVVIPFKQEIQTQKEEVDTNIVDIEDNIIPYLMDVEFNLMMMEDM